MDTLAIILKNASATASKGFTRREISALETIEQDACRHVMGELSSVLRVFAWSYKGEQDLNVFEDLQTLILDAFNMAAGAYDIYELTLDELQGDLDDFCLYHNLNKQDLAAWDAEDLRKRVIAYSIASFELIDNPSITSFYLYLGAKYVLTHLDDFAGEDMDAIIDGLQAFARDNGNGGRISVRGILRYIL